MQRKLSKFEQISIVYRKKYKMSLDDFLSFLKEKVEISQSEIKHVE